MDCWSAMRPCSGPGRRRWLHRITDVDPELSFPASPRRRRRGPSPVAPLAGRESRMRRPACRALEHRGRGLGQALLEAACARFAAADLVEAQLEMPADSPNALRLYERSAMSQKFRFDTYHRTAAARPAP